MIPLGTFIHTLSIAAATGLSALTVAWSQGHLAACALEAGNEQPMALEPIRRALITALALIETAVLLGFIGSIILMNQSVETPAQAVAQMAVALAIVIPSMVLSLASSRAAGAGMFSVARQPFFAQKISNFITLTQSLIQTPLLFSFIIGLVINFQITPTMSMGHALCLLASALCMALATVGPGIGIAQFTEASCASIGVNRSAYANLLSFTIITQAIIEGPVIFATIISFWLISIAGGAATLISGNSYIFFAAALVMAAGTFATGISAGRIASAACKQIAANLHLYTLISRTSTLSLALLDTCAIYTFIVALFLILNPL